MALWCCSPVDRRAAIFGILVVVVGAAILPAGASAIPAPDTEKAYVAFFLGQGGYLFSWGIPLLESKARQLGFATDIFSYTDVSAAWTNIVRRRKGGYKIALVGYSLGNTTATYLQRYLPVDLLVAIAESSLGRNSPINKNNTKRSVLWYGPDMLSNAGVYDGFNETRYVDSVHVLMDIDPRVMSGVFDELKNLVTPNRRDEPIVVANTPLPRPKPVASPINDKIVTAPAPAPAQWLSAGWLPPTNITTRDVTCTNCWGFEQSLGAAGLDPWMQEASQASGDPNEQFAGRLLEYGRSSLEKIEYEERSQKVSRDPAFAPPKTQ
jgi:hypothetical protein